MENIYLSGMWERFSITAYPFYVNHFVQTKKTSTELKVHFHDYAQFFYLVRGKYHHTIGDNHFVGEPGSFMIVPPGYSHFYEIEDEVECEFIMVCVMPNFFDDLKSQSQLFAFAQFFLPQFSKELSFEPVFYREYENEDKEKLEKALMKIASYNWLRNINNFNALRNMLCEIFSAEDFLLSETSIKKTEVFLKNKYIPLIKTIYYMNINYNKKVHRDELISISNLCQTEYFRLIKKALGCTFSTYMQMIRVQRAVQMCSFTTYSLSYIADICGFGDLAYMEKRIKKIHPNGQLPREMKKKRNQYIKSWPFSIKSRSEYENIGKHFYAYGL